MAETSRTLLPVSFSSASGQGLLFPIFSISLPEKKKKNDRMIIRVLYVIPHSAILSWNLENDLESLLSIFMAKISSGWSERHFQVGDCQYLGPSCTLSCAIFQKPTITIFIPSYCPTSITITFSSVLLLREQSKEKRLRGTGCSLFRSLPNLPSCLCGIIDRASVQRALVSSCLTRCFVELEL